MSVILSKMTRLVATETPVLSVNGLKKYFPIRSFFGGAKAYVKAVDGVSLNLYEGKTYGLVGESGCGKSTIGRTLLRLVEPTAGTAVYKGKDILGITNKEFKPYRRELQMIFQDPYSSLNPKRRIGSILEESLKIHKIGTKKDRLDLIWEVMDQVGLRFEYYYRYPHEFSGGQRQRIGIARALIVNPKVIICDEPVSALDVSIQSQIINLLKKLQDEMNLSYLFIAHDISVVRYISDRIGVMYLGHILEDASAEELVQKPVHPYTEALLSAIPLPKPKSQRGSGKRIILEGDIPSPLNPPSGCVFCTRCPYAMPICREETPIRKKAAPDHFVKCHLF